MPLRTEIYNVLPGRPQGRATNGENVTVNADPHTRRVGNITSGTNTLTLNSGAYSNGTLLKLIQLKGLSSNTEENHEYALVVSGGGTSSITLQDNVGRTYTNCQVIDVREYRNSVHNWTVTGWNGNTGLGGIMDIADRGEISGQINGVGLDGFSSNNDNSGYGNDGVDWRNARVGGGYLGGQNSNDGSRADAGEGLSNTWPNEVADPGDGGGGGGNGDWGAGGGSSAAGTSSPTATGGYEIGNDALSSLFLGTGGGGTRAPGQDGPSCGANGGVSGFIHAKFWNQLIINFSGGSGGDSTNPPWGGGGVADGGDGSGGMLRAGVERAIIGTNFITLRGGQTRNNASVGRVAFYYAGVNPLLAGVITYGEANAYFDPKQKELRGPAAFFLD